MIFNLSNIPLTPAETSLLNHGLTFCPTFKPNPAKTKEDIVEFERKAQLPYHFFIRESFGSRKDKDGERSRFGYKPTFFQPTYRCDEITKVANRILEHVSNLISTNSRNKKLYNLSKEEYNAIRSLREKDIIIKPCDKGAGICILSPADYEQKCYQLLNDTKDYSRHQQTTTDINTKIHEESTELLRKFLRKKAINEKEFDYLWTHTTTKMPRFYGLPKIHKEGVPLRPIVSQIDGPTYGLNIACDKFLEGTENNIPNLIRDTREFIASLQNINVPDHAFLVSIDIRSLYTNIPWTEGIRAVMDAYINTYEGQRPPIDPALLERSLDHIMKQNHFTFNGETFHQTFGTAMGAPIAVKYANISTHAIWTRITNDELQPLMFKRLIDDIFMVWTHSEDQLKTFIDNINLKHPTIKFDYSYSPTAIPFLDTIVYIQDNRLMTKLYVKPTDRQAYLHYTSAHPTHTKKSLPYSQALRIRRNTTDDAVLLNSLRDLTKTFAQRGYAKDFILEQTNKVLDRTQTQLLVKRLKHKTTRRIPLVIDFHPHLDKLPSAATKIWHSLITSNRNIVSIYPEPCLTSFRRTKNLKDLLVSSHHPKRRPNPNPNPPGTDHTTDTTTDTTSDVTTDSTTTENTTTTADTTTITDNTTNLTTATTTSDTAITGTVHTHNTRSSGKATRCNQNRCLCCKSINTASSFQSNQTQLHYTIKTHMNCKSRNIIYLITCKKCKQQYVGESSQPLSARMCGHRSAAKNQKNTPIAKHFTLPGHTIDDIAVCPIEQLPNTKNENVNRQHRLDRELHWIKTLRTYKPLGLNQHNFLPTN